MQSHLRSALLKLFPCSCISRMWFRIMNGDLQKNMISRKSPKSRGNIRNSRISHGKPWISNEIRRKAVGKASVTLGHASWRDIGHAGRKAPGQNNPWLVGLGLGWFGAIGGSELGGPPPLGGWVSPAGLAGSVDSADPAGSAGPRLHVPAPLLQERMAIGCCGKQRSRVLLA